jgi:antitoxin component HigA of HigAB toxin-antitoxin module
MRAELRRLFGSAPTRVAEALNRVRPLSLEMIRRLAAGRSADSRIRVEAGRVTPQ